MDTTISHDISIEIVKIFLPIQTLDSNKEVADFLRKIGYDVDEQLISDEIIKVFEDLNKTFVALLEQVQNLNDLIEDENSQDAQVINASARVIENLICFIGEVRGLIAEVDKNLRNQSKNIPDITILVKRTFDLFMYDYLEKYQLKSFSVLNLLGIVEKNEKDIKCIYWGRVLAFFTQPSDIFNQIYDWESNFNHRKFFQAIQLVMRAFSLPGGAYEQDQRLVEGFGKQWGDEKEIRVPLIQTGVWSENDDSDNDYLQLTLNLSSTPDAFADLNQEGTPDGSSNDSEAPPEGEVVLDTYPLLIDPFKARKPGLFLYPVVMGNLLDKQDISDSWFIAIKGNLSLDQSFGIILIPPFDLELIDNIFSDTPTPSGKAYLEIQIGSKLTEGDGEGTIGIFGSENSEFYSGIKSYGGKIFFQFEKQKLFTGFELDLNGLILIIDPSKGDGFLNSILSGIKIKSESDIAIGISNISGVYFRGSSALAINIPIHKQIGSVYLAELNLKLKIQDPLELETRVSFGAALGPIAASFNNIGFKVDVRFPEDQSGNLGFIDVGKPNFLPPTGVGLSINASGITGGGFLDFKDNRYSGVLSLAFGEIGLAAVGLIVTEIPGGPDFALLINIGIVFSPPIQLSMGFTLNGVGGLIAVNRSIKVDALRAGIKNHTLDGILFPEPSSVIANAARIISDMEAIFPVADGQYVVGPMIKIAWAAQLFEGTVGIFIAFPDPVTIVVLGQIKGNIPDKIAPMIKINLDVIGVIDFAAQEFTFQASLYDSKILNYDIFGDSAMLIGWGDNPRFALSLGGFHPKFTPPAPAIVFADMRRLTIDISNSSAVHLVCSAYLAVTSNSLQFGARAEMYISAGPISVDGFIQFDALFIFSPFSFEIGISAGVHLCWEGTSLLGIDLDFVLSGPTPWHAHGTASISFFFFSIDVGFDVTWGDDRKVEQAPVNPWTELKKALELADNWGSVLPSRRSMVEMLRPKDVKTEEQAIVLHPFGILEVRQQVCPLGDIPEVANFLSGSDLLDKIGNAPVEVYNAFRIENFLIPGKEDPISKKENPISKGEDISEYFAPGQYWELTQDQKLSCPSFIPMTAGVKSSAVVGTKVVGKPEQATLSYESSIFTAENITEQMPGSRRVEWQRVSHLVEAQSARRLAQSADPLQAYSRYTKPLRVKIGSAQNKTERTVRLQKRPLVTLKHMPL